MGEPNIVACSMAVGAEFQENVRACVESHARYCERHGLEYVLETSRLDEHRPIPWSKIRVLQRALADERVELAVWLDADTLITNERIAMEDWLDLMGDRDLLIARDVFGGLNSGVMILRNTKWVARWLEKVYAQTHLVNSWIWENAAVQELHEAESEIRDRTFVVQPAQAHAFNAFVYNFRESSWLLHFAGHGKEKLRSFLAAYEGYASRDVGFDLSEAGVWFDRDTKRYVNLAKTPENDALVETCIRSIRGTCECFPCRRYLKQFGVQQA